LLKFAAYLITKRPVWDSIEPFQISDLNFSFHLKAFFTFICLVFLLGQTASGQQATKTAEQTIGPVYGFRAGGNLSTFSSSDPFKDLYLGYHVGVFLDMYPSKKYGYSFELNYAKQGAKSGDVIIPANYLVVPALFNIYASGLALQGGVYAAPLLAGSVNNLDFGLAIGIKKALGDFGLGVRYYHGLQEISDCRDKAVNQKLELSIRINLQ
jgi:hypothetical protein